MGLVQSSSIQTSSPDQSIVDSGRQDATVQVWDAVRSGNANSLAELLHTPTASLTSLDDETGETVLHLAASLDNHEVLQALLRDPRCDQDQLELQDKQGYTPLMRAVERTDARAMELLTTASDDSRDFFSSSTYNDSFPTDSARQHASLATLYCRSEGNSSVAVQYAIRAENSESARFFVDLGGDPLASIRKITVARQAPDSYLSYCYDKYAVMSDQVGWSLDKGLIDASHLMLAIDEASAAGEDDITRFLAKHLARAAPEQQLDNAIHFASKNVNQALPGLFSGIKKDYSDDLLTVLHSKTLTNNVKVPLAHMMSLHSQVDSSVMVSQLFRQRDYESLALLIKAEVPVSFLVRGLIFDRQYDQLPLLASLGADVESLLSNDTYKSLHGNPNDLEELGAALAGAAISHFMFKDEGLSNDQKTEKLQLWLTNYAVAKQGAVKALTEQARDSSAAGLLDRVKPMIDAGVSTTELLGELGKRSLRSTALEFLKRDADFDSSTKNIGRAMEMLIAEGESHGAGQLAMVLESLISAKRDSGLPANRTE